jgi:hypothetical protein
MTASTRCSTARRPTSFSDQKAPEQFAGKKVKITGALFEKTQILKIDSIKADGK